MKIDKGVPIPGQSRQNHSKYRFHEMEVGDSFFIKEEDHIAVHRVRNRVTNAACSFSHRHGHKFTIRTVDGGVRCWRIE